MSTIFNRFARPFGLSLVGAMALGAMSTSALAQQWKLVVLDPPGSLFPQTTGVWGNVQVGSAYYGPEGGEYEHAVLWNGAPAPLVDLTPSFASSSSASGMFGDQQVGTITVNGVTHAGLWHGTAASFVDLDPAGGSGTSGTSGSQQVGTKGGHAVMWSGSAESMVDLHPAFALSSSTTGVGNGQQVGGVSFNGNHGPDFHACMWRGTSASFVDLHHNGWTSSTASGVSGGHQVGWMFPLPNHGYPHAILWNGSSASWIDLTPSGRVSAMALGGTDGYQVGWVEDRAALWTGTAESCVDLSVYLPEGYINSSANSVWTDGRTLAIVGNAYSEQFFPEYAILRHAVLWTLDLAGPTCPADFDRDGALDFFDYDAFVVCFEGSCPQGRTADFDGDGTVDFNDYDAFVFAFEAGC